MGIARPQVPDDQSRQHSFNENVNAVSACTWLLPHAVAHVGCYMQLVVAHVFTVLPVPSMTTVCRAFRRMPVSSPCLLYIHKMHARVLTMSPVHIQHARAVPRRPESLPPSGGRAAAEQKCALPALPAPPQGRRKSCSTDPSRRSVRHAVAPWHRGTPVEQLSSKIGESFRKKKLLHGLVL